LVWNTVPPRGGAIPDVVGYRAKIGVIAVILVAIAAEVSDTAARFPVQVAQQAEAET
jgi:hypothetical protein